MCVCVLRTLVKQLWGVTCVIQSSSNVFSTLVSDTTNVIIIIIIIMSCHKHGYP